MFSLNSFKKSVTDNDQTKVLSNEQENIFSDSDPDTSKEEELEFPKTIYLNCRVITVKKIQNFEGNFIRGNLIIQDIICGGPSRSVEIDYSIQTETGTIFLKTVEELPKREFEEIFFFGVGQFVRGRIISTSLENIKIY